MQIQQYASPMTQDVIGPTGLGGMDGDVFGGPAFAGTPGFEEQPIAMGQDIFFISGGLAPDSGSHQILATMQRQQITMQATINQQNARLDQQDSTIQHLRQIVDNVVRQLNEQTNGTQFVNMADIQRRQ